GRAYGDDVRGGRARRLRDGRVERAGAEIDKRCRRIVVDRADQGEHVAAGDGAVNLAGGGAGRACRHVGEGHLGAVGGHADHLPARHVEREGDLGRGRVPAAAVVYGHLAHLAIDDGRGPGGRCSTTRRGREYDGGRDGVTAAAVG